LVALQQIAHMPGELNDSQRGGRILEKIELRHWREA
jgi:hypothetical protein